MSCKIILKPTIFPLKKKKRVAFENGKATKKLHNEQLGGGPRKDLAIKHVDLTQKKYDRKGDYKSSLQYIM